MMQALLTSAEHCLKPRQELLSSRILIIIDVVKQADNAIQAQQEKHHTTNSNSNSNSNNDNTDRKEKNRRNTHRTMIESHNNLLVVKGDTGISSLSNIFPYALLTLNPELYIPIFPTYP